MRKNDILVKIIRECLNTMYVHATPSITFNELEKLAKKEYEETGIRPEMYQRYYLSSEEIKYISDMFLENYNLKNPFKEHCDIVSKYLFEGGLKDVYVTDSNGIGHRDYEHTPKLSELLEEEDVSVVKNLIDSCKNFYNFNRTENQFSFEVMNLAPCSNKQTVIDYWKTQDVNLTIDDRNMDYNYERYYLECSEEEINELIEEDNATNTSELENN